MNKFSFLPEIIHPMHCKYKYLFIDRMKIKILMNNIFSSYNIDNKK